MFKRAPRALCFALALLLGACGTPATPAPPPPPTRALPTRVPIQPSPDAHAGIPATATPAVVVAAPTSTPTRIRPTATPTITLIPPTPTPLPPTDTPAPTATRVPDAASGEALFRNGLPGKPEVPTCLSCHHVEPGATDVKTGPSLVGIVRVAGSRMPGQDARTYLRRSILYPNEHLVPNEAGQPPYAVGDQSLMYQTYGEELTNEQLEDIVAYLLTLR